MGTITKALIGEEDINFWTGDSTQTTFTRLASLGGTQTMTKFGYEVDALRAHGGGNQYTQAVITAALTAIGTTQKATLLLRPGTWVISSNVDWSSYTNVTFKVVPGAVLQVATGCTLTIGGPFEAGLYQVFSGSGTVSFGTDAIKEVNTVWFPESASGFAQAVSATPLYSTLRMSGGTHTFSTTLTINKVISFVMDDDTTISSSVSGTALDITASMDFGMRFKIRVSRSVDWTSGNVGVEFHDIHDCTIEIPSAYGFEKGVYFNMTAGSANMFFNKITLGQLYQNKYAVYVQGGTGALAGNINGNNFYGGRVDVTAAVNPTVDRYGFYISGASTNNFYGPGIATVAGSGGGKGYGVYFDSASYFNKIYGAYFEEITYVIGANENAKSNYVQAHIDVSAGGLASSFIDESTANFPGTNVIEWSRTQNVSLGNGGLSEVYPVTDVFSRALVNNISGSDRLYYVPGFTFVNRTTGAYTLGTASSVNLTDNYMELDGERAIGRKIDTKYTKDFWMSIEYDSATSLPYFVVICYDAAGVRLNAGTHVKGTVGDVNTANSFAATTDFGGAYIVTSVSKNTTVFFHVASTVKYIFAGVYAGPSSVIGLNAISLKVNGNRCPVSWAGYDFVSEGTYMEPGRDLISIASPVGGVFNNGTKIWDADVAATADPGWIVTNRQTTAVNFATGYAAGTTDIVVDSSTGINASDILGALITSTTTGIKKWWWTTQSGGPADGTHLKMTHAVPDGYTLDDNAKIITYLPKAMANID